MICPVDFRSENKLRKDPGRSKFLDFLVGLYVNKQMPVCQTRTELPVMAGNGYHPDPLDSNDKILLHKSQQQLALLILEDGIVHSSIPSGISK